MANLDDYIWLGVTVEGQFIKRNDDIRIVQYQVGKVKLMFTGSSEWDGMDIIARFRHGSTVYDIALTSSQAEDGVTEGECVIPHEITDIIGSFEMALRGENDDGLVITSDPTTFTVVETIFSGDSLGEPEPATPSILKQILDGEAARVSNEQARVTAESARVSAEATRQSQFTTAINNANAATENANDAAALARANIPYKEITGSIASTTDADNGAVMKELTVHGKTVQNLWVNPSGGESGMTATPNEDGSVTIVAQRSGQACPVATAHIYGLQEGKTYTLIVDPPTRPQSTWPSVAVYINGSTSPHYYEGTFEMGGLYIDDQGAEYATATIWVNSMDPINQRYRVMLVEGDAAEPWCPPGLSSVSELGLVSAGKNLLSESLEGKSPGTTIGTPYLLADFGHDVQLGTQATAYEPPHVTTTPIDLSGHELRSLPDGTCDVLTVDGSGAVVVEQATAEIVLDGSSDESYYIDQADGSILASYALSLNAIDNHPQIWCDTLPASTTGKPRVYIANNGRTVYFLGIDGATNAESFRTWLSQHPTTIIYPRATPQTIHLPPITPPILHSPTFNVWAATDVPTTIDLSYGWDASGMLNQATPSLCREGIRNLFM